MNWFVLNIFSVFALASAELCQQHLLTTSKQTDERASSILTFFFQALCALGLLLLLGLKEQLFLTLSNRTLFLFVCVSLIGSVAILLYLRSFKVKSLSFSLIFISWSAVVSSTLGIIFLGESANSIKFTGMALVLGSIILLNFRNLHLEKNHLFALIAGFLFGLTFTLDKTIVMSIHPLAYLFWCCLLISILSTFPRPGQTFSFIKTLTLRDCMLTMVSGIAYFLFNYSTFMAYKLGGEVGRVDAINNSQVFVVIGVEYFLFKQQDGIGRKIASSLLAILGVFLLGNF